MLFPLEGEEMGRPTAPLCHNETGRDWLSPYSEAKSHGPCLRCPQDLIHRGDREETERSVPLKAFCYMQLCAGPHGEARGLVRRQRRSGESKAQSLYSGFTKRKG